MFAWCVKSLHCQIVSLFCPPAVPFEQLKKTTTVKGGGYSVSECGWVKEFILMYSVMK